MRAHRFRAGDDVAEAEFAGVAPRGAAQLVLQRIDAQRIADRHLEAFGADRLDDEVRRARAHGGNDDLDRAMRRLDDRGHRDIALAHPRQHPHAVEIGHDEVEDQEIDRRSLARLEARERGFARFHAFGVVAKSSGHRLEQAPLDGIVIDNEYESGHRAPTAASEPRIARHCGITVNAMLTASRSDPLSSQKRRFVFAKQP